MSEKEIHPTTRRLYEAARILKGAARPSDVAALFNMSQGRVQNWEDRGVSKEAMMLAPKAVGCRVEWISDGELPMEVEGNYKDAVKNKEIPDELIIPRFEAEGSMGHGRTAYGNAGIIENLRVSPEWLRNNLKGYTSTKNLCVVTGHGESMKPMFNPGDPVIVDLSINEYVGPYPYFFRVGDDNYIKRLQKIPGRGIVAIPESSKYRDFDITDDMDFQIIGRVLKVWCSEDF